MACSCSSKKTGGTATWTVVMPGGAEPITYSSDIAAYAKAKQVQGAYVVDSSQPS